MSAVTLPNHPFVRSYLENASEDFRKAFDRMSPKEQIRICKILKANPDFKGRSRLEITGQRPRSGR